MDEGLKVRARRKIRIMPEPGDAITQAVRKSMMLITEQAHVLAEVYGEVMPVVVPAYLTEVASELIRLALQSTDILTGDQRKEMNRSFMEHLIKKMVFEEE